MSGPAAPIALPLPVRYLGSVNVWLLPGDPLTLVDTGPATADALTTLEQQLSLHGLRLEQVELVLLTHHHLDHTGLATRIQERSGAAIAAHHGTARWGSAFEQRVAAEREFTRSLIAQHGVPARLTGQVEEFLALIATEGRAYEVTQVLSDGDIVRAGGRDWRTVYRPGHSSTDTLFVDDEADEAFVGDHLLAEITTGAELMPTELPGDERRRALMDYLGNLRKTRVMPLHRCYTGHGPVIEDHQALIDRRAAFHAERLARIEHLVATGCDSAFAVARQLWSPEVAAASPVLVVWEVLGHLDLLVNRGVVRETVDDAGCHRFTVRRRQPASSPR